MKELAVCHCTECEKPVDRTLAIIGDCHYSNYSMFAKIVKDELQRFPATKIVTADSTGIATMALTFSERNNIPLTVYCNSRGSFRRLGGQGIDVILTTKPHRGQEPRPEVRIARLLKPAQKVLLFDAGDNVSKLMRKVARVMKREVELWTVDHGEHFAVEPLIDPRSK